MKKEEIQRTKVEVQEAITRITVGGTGECPKCERFNRGGGVESATAVKFCAPIEGESASEKHKQDNKGSSAKNNEWTQEVVLSEISDVNVRDKAYEMPRKYSGMWSGEPGRITETELRIVLKRAPDLHIKFRTGKYRRCVGWRKAKLRSKSEQG